MSGHHHHSHGLFPEPDPHDPWSMMGVAMVGMALQEMAEREEHERRARLTPWERAEEDRRAREAADNAWRLLAKFLLVSVAILAGLLALWGVISLIQWLFHMLTSILQSLTEFAAFLLQWAHYLLQVTVRWVSSLMPISAP